MELLKELLSLKCPAGFENRGSAELKKIAEKFCHSVWEDSFSNIYARVNPEIKGEPTIVICAHFDSIGLIVTEVKNKGFLKFDTLGGVDPRVLPGAEVTVLGKEDIYGVIGIRPVHILKNEEMKKSELPETLTIDTSVNKEKLETLVRVGTPVIFKSEPLLNKNYISANYLDNRAGVYTALKVAEKVKGEKVNVILLFTASEELGRKGAAASTINADVAVIVDATFGKSPYCSKAEAKELGSGPVLCKGPVLSRKYTALLESVAKENGIPYNVEAEGGDPGTDAFVLETASGGTPCVMVSYPLKYMHTGIETVNLTDLENSSELICSFAKGLKEV